ncbi:hypothetical protein [Mycolicibacter minnesotensis]
MTTHAEGIAWLAKLDQRRAESEQVLSIAIADYRQIINQGNETHAFVATVKTVLDLIDPDDRFLDDDHRENLTKVAECFACAVGRLVQAGDR